MMEEFIDSPHTVRLQTMLAGTSYSLTEYLQVHLDVGVKELRLIGAL